MKAYLIMYLAACALGYCGRVFVERQQRRHRERVLRALGGKVPDWEEKARELEGLAQAAFTQEQKDLNNAKRCADRYLAQADVTRRRGRRRDREWP